MPGVEASWLQSCWAQTYELQYLPKAAFSADTAVFVRDRFELSHVQRFDFATVVLWCDFNDASAAEVLLTDQQGVRWVVASGHLKSGKTCEAEEARSRQVLGLLEPLAK